MDIFAAPLQGFTDNVWRESHSAIYGGITRYYTPFIRLERGAVRSRDQRGIDPAVGQPYAVVPQIIFNSASEFCMLVDILALRGIRCIDLNLGCPFPPQVKHGRGAGAIRRDLLVDVSRIMGERYGDIRFSVKMRLGMDAPDEWKSVADILDSMPLSHVAVHPRIARQQYSGPVDMTAFREISSALHHNIIYNGDILSVDDIHRVGDEYSPAGIMIGRGLLSRPSLAAEYLAQEWTREKRIDTLRCFFDEIYSRYKATLCGDTQILSKIKPFWEWLEPEIGHKACKKIRKASSSSGYEAAVAVALSL